MCGIVGYVGNKQVVPLIIDGLRKLEYRGYDSAGIAVVGRVRIISSCGGRKGSCGILEECIQAEPARRHITASGTRGGRRTADRPRRTRTLTVINRARSSWCTTASSKTIWRLKDRLASNGSTFNTETDTEVIAHLIGHYKEKENLSLEKAVRKAVKELRGIFRALDHFGR